jgi:hypothetical protein
MGPLTFVGCGGVVCLKLGSGLFKGLGEAVPGRGGWGGGLSNADDRPALVRSDVSSIDGLGRVRIERIRGL